MEEKPKHPRKARREKLDKVASEFERAKLENGVEGMEMVRVGDKLIVRPVESSKKP